MRATEAVVCSRFIRDIDEKNAGGNKEDPVLEGATDQARHGGEEHVLQLPKLFAKYSHSPLKLMRWSLETQDVMNK